MPEINNPLNYYLFSESEYKMQIEPVFISLCFLGIPCRWHGRRPAIREKLIKKLKLKYALIPLCPEQLGGMPTPRTSESLCGLTGEDILDRGYRLIAPETGKDVTEFHIKGGNYALEIAQMLNIKKAYLKSGSPSCDKNGVCGEILRRGGVKVIAVP